MAHTAITADLHFPGYHLHDETHVPLEVAPAARRSEFKDKRASFTWTTSLRCPQCGLTFEVAGRVDLEAAMDPGVTVSWHHGEGPNVPRV